MDSGIGVSADLQQKLFEPFVQADLSVSRKYGGTGLGLSISQSLVELLGGRLTLVSEPGNGSEFSFTLTFQNAVAQTHIDPSDVMERRFDNRQIIITGRSRHMMERLCQCLSMIGHSIEPVTSLESWCRTVQEKSQGDGEYFLISLGKPPKRWLQNVSLENQKIFKRRIVIADPLTRSGSEDINGGDIEEIRLSCPVKVSQILAALDGIKTQSISGAQPQVSESGSLPVVAEQTSSQRNSLSKRSYAKSREFSRTMSSNLAHSEDRKPFRALIADDNAINLRVSKLLLSQFGLEADVAASGFEALEKARLNDYDIIFLDCQMPQMDGFDTCRRIKINQGKQGKWAPVIAVTANSFSVVKESYSRSGMDDFLPKPILSENLFNILSKWLDSDDNSRTIMRQTHRRQSQAERQSAITPPSFESQEDMETTEADGNSQLRPDLLLSRFGTEHVQLLELFQHSAPENLTQLKQSLSKRELEDVMKRAHGFKGVCGTICATACEIVLKRLEKEAKSNDYDKAAASLGELDDNLQGLLMEIHNYLKAKNNKESQPKS
jgi:FOG: CheY-like receiver